MKKQKNYSDERWLKTTEKLDCKNSEDSDATDFWRCARISHESPGSGGDCTESQSNFKLPLSGKFSFNSPIVGSIMTTQ